MTSACGAGATVPTCRRPPHRLERGHGGAHCWEEPVGADLGGEARLLEDLALPPLQPREAERDAALLQIRAQLTQGSMEVASR